MEDKVPDTSETFDDMIGYKETVGRPGSLATFLGESDIPETEEEAEARHNYMNWREHWQDMPEYDSEKLMPAKKLQINFDTEEDFFAFSKIVGTELTLKTKSIRWPLREKDVNILKRWFDTDV